MPTSIKNLTHHFLIAAPQMPDGRFARSLIYICRHDEHGALGLIINNPMLHTVNHLLDDLNILVHNPKLQDLPALLGGPMHPEVGFVLHTGQPTWSSSFAISENICITTSRDILESLANNNSVEHFHLCLGHASWGKQQIFDELANGDWLVCPADLNLIFRVPFEQRWHQAGKILGIDLDFMGIQTGHA